MDETVWVLDVYHAPNQCKTHSLLASSEEPVSTKYQHVNLVCKRTPRSVDFWRSNSR